MVKKLTEFCSDRGLNLWAETGSTSCLPNALLWDKDEQAAFDFCTAQRRFGTVASCMMRRLKIRSAPYRLGGSGFERFNGQSWQMISHLGMARGSIEQGSFIATVPGAAGDQPDTVIFWLDHDGDGTCTKDDLTFFVRFQWNGKIKGTAFASQLERGNRDSSRLCKFLKIDDGGNTTIMSFTQ